MPGSQHPYSYALNNPADYTDPSGKFVPLVIGGLYVAPSVVAAGGIAIAGIGAIAYTHQDDLNALWNLCTTGESGLSASALDWLQAQEDQPDKNGVIKGRRLPTRGKIRYVPPSSWQANAPSHAARRTATWTKTATNGKWDSGQEHWDVQLSRKGKAQLGWASNSAST